MNGLAMMMTMAVLGVDYGWQPGTDGQLEYIIQIEPAVLDSLRQGEKIVSEIHPDARGARRFVIQVGTGKLPRQGLALQAPPSTRLGSPQAQPGSPAASSPAGPTLYQQDQDTSPATGSLWQTPEVRSNVSQSSQFTALPGEGIVSSFLKNLPPPPATGQGNAIAPTATGSVPGVVRADPSAGPTLAEPSQGAQPTPPQFPAATDGQGGSFQVPPYVGAGVSTGGPTLGNGGFPINNGNAAGGGQSPSESRPISPPTLHDRGPAPIVDPDASKGGRKGSDTIAGSETPADRAGRLAAGVTLPKDAAFQKPTIDEKTARELAEAEASKPWLPLVFTSFALFASLAANMYLGWIAVGIYRRYRSVVGQLHQARTATA